MIKGPVNTTAGVVGVVSDAKRIFLQHNNQNAGISENAIFALINCTGLSARHFVGPDEAAKLYPIRGQTVLVRGECAMARTCTDFPSEDASELAYVIPRPGSGTTILGGCKQAGNWDDAVDEALTARILERVKRWGLAEELRTGEGREFEVLSTQVGFRPGRKGGPRVEVEGLLDGVWVVHAYGHGGAGYQSSVGSAEKVVSLVDECRLLKSSL